MPFPGLTKCPQPLSSPILSRDHAWPPLPRPPSRAGLPLENPGTGVLHNALFAQLSSLRQWSDHLQWVDRFPAPLKFCDYPVPRRDPYPWQLSWAKPAFNFVLTDPASTIKVASLFTQHRAHGFLLIPDSVKNHPSFVPLFAIATASISIEVEKRTFRFLSPHAQALASESSLTALLIDHWPTPGVTPLYHPPSKMPGSLSIHPQWESLVSPPRTSLSPGAFEHFLQHHPDDLAVRSILFCISFGFQYGYTGDRSEPLIPPIHPDYLKHKGRLDALRSVEKGKRWRTGMFSYEPGSAATLPLFNLRGGPCRGITKSLTDKLRGVNNLSWPYDFTSVNANIPSDGISHLKFSALCMLLAILGVGALFVSFDTVGAYKVADLCPSDWHLGGEHLYSGLAFNLKVVFGSTNGGDLFERLALMIEFVLRHHAPVDYLLRYADDFLALFPPSTPKHRVLAVIASIKAICLALGVPMAKWKGPCTRIEWLGRVLDSIKMTAELTAPRIVFLQRFISSVLSGKTRFTTQLVRSLHGHLQFAATVAQHGKAFLWNLAKLAQSTYGRPVLSKLVRSDLQWWAHLLTVWNGVSLIREPKYSFKHDRVLYTDAAKTGFGAYYNGHWLAGPWPKGFLARATRRSQIDINFLEMLAIFIGCASFCHLFPRAKVKILIRTDSMVSVHCLNNFRVKSPDIRYVVRALLRLAQTKHFDMRVAHIAGKCNIQADLLSRLFVSAFLQKYPNSDPEPTTICLPPIPHYVWPSNLPRTTLLPSVPASPTPAAGDDS
jgi:hypothetical protein